jgi:ABC-type antimicrobial peptide transport system permease subunit
MLGATHIVGVLRDLSYQHPLDDIDPMMLAGSGISFGGVAILESKLPRAALQKQAREALRALDLNMMGDIQSLAKIHRDILAPDRARGLLTIITALIVVLLAAFGFYGTQRYLVTAGRREYAIRASLGAGPRSLERLVLRRGLMLGIPGLVLGTPLAFIVVAWLRGDYVSRTVSPWVVTLSVVLGLLGLLLLASLGPARFARRTQPAPLLRED